MTEPPYPDDTRCKGWRFELDHERIRQSDTWALSPAEIRPWLLMLWMVAWEQTPCGALPNSDELIAARIGMKPAAFAKAKEYLMRGWSMASNGRLYHPVMVERVLEMMRKRRSDSDRQATRRARNHDGQDVTSEVLAESHAGVTRDTRVTHAVLTRESSTGTGTNIKKRNPPTPRKRGSAPDGFEDFYAPFPRKDARAKAESAWRSLNPPPELVAVIVADVKRRSAGVDWQKENGRYVPLPATYLNGRRWEDAGVQLPPAVAESAPEPLNAPTYKSRDWGNESPMEIAK